MQEYQHAVKGNSVVPRQRGHPATVVRRNANLPDGSHQYQETNLLGQITRQWGSQTNPVSFTYDAAGRRATLTTYRAPVGANADTFPSITGDTTTWTYDPSGVLLQKTYADGKGPHDGEPLAARKLEPRLSGRMLTLHTTGICSKASIPPAITSTGIRVSKVANFAPFATARASR